MDFIDIYKKGDIVYPNAVARNYSISKEKAYNLCEEKLEESQLKRLYLINCPHCNRIASERYYSVASVPDYAYCIHCDNEIEYPAADLIDVYEKV